MDTLGLHHTTQASKLDELSSKLASQGGKDEWQQVEISAQALANGLRVRSEDVDTHTILGKTQLPQTLARILQLAGDGEIPSASRASAVLEILRVAANLCLDHDENRGHLLDAEFPQLVVALLASYEKAIPADRKMGLLPMTVPHLKVVKTAIGVLLNACIGYEPVKSLLIDLQAAVTILRLATAIYPVGSWITAEPRSLYPENEPDPTSEVVTESWTLRSDLSNWAWRIIFELKADALDLFDPEDLSLFILPLATYSPPFPSPSGQFEHDSHLRRALVQTDFNVFEESCSLLESMAIDVEDVRLALARGMSSPDEHDGVNCLMEIYKFVEDGDYHPLWPSDFPGERARKVKAFDHCKAALIKVVVEVAGEKKNVDVLWDDSDNAAPGGAFVSKMVHWIKSQEQLKEEDRDDLLVCATLSLGNLMRYEVHAVAIVEEPIALGPYLAAILEPETDMKVKHGVIGLLRHLAYASKAREPLGKVGIIGRLIASNIFQENSAIAGLVQVNAIGIAKHLCSGNDENCYALLFSSQGQDPSPSGLEQILDLIRRSDDVPIKSEGTRVFVNVIRTLWSKAPDDERRTKGMVAITSAPVALALAQLIGRSKKYPSLVNEGIVGLTLLTLYGKGADYVLDAITSPLPQEAQINVDGPSAEATDLTSPVTNPRRALDVIMAIFTSTSKRFPEEVRANICTLLGHIGRAGAVTEDRMIELQRLKEEVRPKLEDAKNVEQQTRLQQSSLKALQLWS